MNLKDIISISGEPGLFRFIAQGKNAIIVEHLETKKRSSAYSSSKISSLEDISIFTEKEDIPLGKVFNLVFEKENGGPAIDSKSDVIKLKSYFEEVLHDYSKEKVYPSDIKKVVQWYNILHKLNLLIPDEPEKNSETQETMLESENKPVAEKKKRQVSPGQKAKNKI